MVKSLLIGSRCCLRLRPFKLSQTSRNLSGVSQALGPDEIAAALAKPSWSVKSLIDTSQHSNADVTITQKQLHHLLRLSALPLPKSEGEEAKMIQTLQSQLQFVQAIQKVDTKGVLPLQGIRDETSEAEKESEINMDLMREELEKEEFVGPSRRIKKKNSDQAIDSKETEIWDPLARAPKKHGRYIVVETGKE